MLPAAGGGGGRCVRMCRGCTLSTSLRSVSTSLILRGVLAVVVGVIAFGWPGITILALVILFAIYAFMDAVFEGMRAFSSATAGLVIGHLLLSLIGVAAGWSPSSGPGPPRWCW